MYHLSLLDDLPLLRWTKRKHATAEVENEATNETRVSDVLRFHLLFGFVALTSTAEVEL